MDMQNKSVADLLGDLIKEVTDLFRAEGELIRAEISEKVSQVGAGAGSAIAGAICMLVALLVLVQAIVIGVAKIFDMGAGWASLLVGLVFAIIGAVFIFKAKNDLTDLTPDRTARQIRKDAQLAKDKLS